MNALVRGGLYFVIVFATGFMLGVVRVIWVAPTLGERGAELAELPIMLGASYAAARFVVSRSVPETRAELLAAGFFALVLLLGLEFTVVLAVRGLSLAEYLASRDPVSGAAYAVSLLVFAVLPWMVGRGSERADD